MDEKLLEECVDYFKSNPGFKRAFKKMEEKYKSLGTLGGTINLVNLSDFEKEAFTGFFKKNYYKKEASIKVENFIKALDNTKFSGVDFKIVLEKYFNHKLYSKKEEKTQYEEKRYLFYKGITDELHASRGKQWLSIILESDGSGTRFINQKYQEDRENLKYNLKAVCRAVDIISFNRDNLIRLAVLASRVTKNPHFFDNDKDAGKLLVFAIIFFKKAPYPKNAEGLSELMYSAGIIRDEVSNYTLCSGMLAYSEKNEIHRGWQGFYNSGEPIQVSLFNISRTTRIVSPCKKVYVFENPTVFTEILNRTLEIKPSLMCTFGNFKLASLILMDKLVESGAVIYYSGDMDPEGIIMADKLNLRYGKKLILWRYDTEDYKNIISDVELGEMRIKKLQLVESPKLKKICETIINYKRAAYQELLIDKYEEDIRKARINPKRTGRCNEGIKTDHKFTGNGKI